MITGAILSVCEAYRYSLWRYWDADKPRVAFCMLNPSTADAVVNDPTIERCQRRAMAWGYGGVEVVNLFALRSTDPRALRPHPDPVGAGNDDAILAVASNTSLIVCAWGKDGRLRDRDLRVLNLIHRAHRTPHVLRVNKDGTPAHPLYLPYTLKPEPWVYS